MRFSSLLALVPLVGLAVAGPTPFVQKRQLDLPGNLAAILQGVAAAVSQGDPTGVTAALRNVVRAADRPTTPEQFAATLQAILQGTAPPPANLFAYIANLEALNLIDTIDALIAFINDAANGQNSPNNNNPPPPDVIYPQKLSCDALYSVDENTLRSAIYIPPGFTYGTTPPVILFPGTGNYGYETFKGNFIPLLTGSNFADPVWVNVPGRLLNDAQKNAEFAAYAINYIRSITNNKDVTMLAWSQGNIDAQWAYKYWPSTTKAVIDHVAISADYDGTVVANFVGLPGAPLPPSLLQQQYLASSNFITTLQTCDGDSGYVPTTSIYSGFFDEIVQPQQGTAASAFIKDVRGVGVTNTQVQLVCPGQPAGSFYTHEGVLYNPLAYYLLRDAMTNPGPGDVSRLQLSTVCATYLAPGLSLGDLLVTENTVAIAGLAILTYPNPVLVEPAISAYAQTCPVSTCISTSTTTTTTTMSSTSTTLTTTTGTTTTTTTTTSSATASISTTSSGTISSGTTSATSSSSTATTSTMSGTTTSTASTSSGKTTSTTKSSYTTSKSSTSSDYTTTSSDYTTTSSDYTTTSSDYTTTSSDYTTTSSDYTTISSDYTTTTREKDTSTSSTNTWADWESWTTTTTTTTTHHTNPPKSTGTETWETWSPEPTSDHEQPDPTNSESWASWALHTEGTGNHSHNPAKPTKSINSQTWETWSPTKIADGHPSKPTNDDSSQTWATWSKETPAPSGKPHHDNGDNNNENNAVSEAWNTWASGSAGVSASKTGVEPASATAQGTWSSWSGKATATPSAIVGTWKGAAAGKVQPGAIMVLAVVIAVAMV